ncbi:hypothetical protein [Paenibacillus sp. GbtcB18]|uniref:hypothetical protein n=1 Tax=Paenibacillus sp. GbtcB18 TaxID=2824763 RepID=UPI001C2F1233|nr:hypothetical protein [Paenibacillus sp. GbtcB18]
MLMNDFKIRIFANACITRYNNNEGPIEHIVGSYNLIPEVKKSILEYVYFKRPDFNPENQDLSHPEHQTGR